MFPSKLYQKREQKERIPTLDSVGGYGYKDCSGGLLVGMPL